jgi:ATP-binding cassette subfamily F protein uup
MSDDNLITLDNISLAYGLNPLLDRAKLQIASGERVCLIGRNGAGKSSLLKVIEGLQKPDDGAIWYKPKLRMARLAQELPQQACGTVYEIVAQGLAETGRLLTEYHVLIERLTHTAEQKDLDQLERLQHALDANNGWQLEQTIKTVLTRLELNPDELVSNLSGGWQRRVLLAQALVTDPELLLLDEPTNHLDIAAIQWLEDYLLNCNIGLLFITHDRALLQRLATRILELDRGQLTSWPGDYQNFLRRKAEMLHAEAQQNAEFDKKLAQEEQWIRQGIKARRTRNEGRVRALEDLRRERAKRIEVQGKANFNVQDAEKSGHLVIEAKGVTQCYGERKIINNFSMRIMRGDRIGLIGPNGIGKSTLLNILLGELKPQQGTVTHGTKLQIAYFDQLRQSLDLEKTVLENVAHGRDFIEINNKRQHIMSYLSDFLFTPPRALTPVKALSGGECNRLVLARLFSQPANLLVLDEPTNDLDLETLELLEEILGNYQGTLLLVSHDREFLDNVITSTLVFEGDGKISEYVGGYNDWLRQSKQNKKIINQTVGRHARESGHPDIVNDNQQNKNKKLSYKEQKELTELPKKIEVLEIEQTDLQLRSADPDFYQKNPDLVAQTMARLKQLQNELAQLYKRWEELEKNS